MEFKFLEKKVIYYWFFIRLLLFIPYLVAYIFMVIFTPKDYLILPLVPWTVGLIILFILTFIFPYFSYKNRLYAFDDNNIIYNYGVIFRHKIIVPIRNIQDIGYVQGPLKLVFNLATIVISTAGSTEKLVCLNRELAQNMIIDIEKKINAIYVKKGDE